MIVNFDIFKGKEKQNDTFNSLKLDVEYSVSCARLFALIAESFDDENNVYTFKPLQYIIGGTIKYKNLTFTLEIANVLFDPFSFSQYIISQSCTYEENGNIYQYADYTLRGSESGYIDRMINFDELRILPQNSIENSINEAYPMRFFKGKKSDSKFITNNEFLKGNQ